MIFFGAKGKKLVPENYPKACYWRQNAHLEKQVRGSGVFSCDRCYRQFCTKCNIDHFAKAVEQCKGPLKRLAFSFDTSWQSKAEHVFEKLRKAV